MRPPRGLAPPAPPHTHAPPASAHWRRLRRSGTGPTPGGFCLPESGGSPWSGRRPPARPAARCCGPPAPPGRGASRRLCGGGRLRRPARVSRRAGDKGVSAGQWPSRQERAAHLGDGARRSTMGAWAASLHLGGAHGSSGDGGVVSGRLRRGRQLIPQPTAKSLPSPVSLGTPTASNNPTVQSPCVRHVGAPGRLRLS